MSTQAAYLATSEGREPCHFTPEMSRRARGVEVWAALASLGRASLFKTALAAPAIDQNRRHAPRDQDKG
jgi:hypothetical protein